MLRIISQPHFMIMYGTLGTSSPALTLYPECQTHERYYCQIPRIYLRCPAVSWNRRHSHRTRETSSSSQRCTDQVDICDYAHHPSDHGGIVILIRQLDLTGHASQSRKGILAIPIRTVNTLCHVHRRLSDWVWCQDQPHTSRPAFR